MHRKIVGVLHLVMGLMAIVPVMIVTAVFGGIWGVVAYASQGHEATTIVGIIEVMKLMNTVRAGLRGTVLEIMARDGALVEYGEALMRVVRAD